MSEPMATSDVMPTSDVAMMWVITVSVVLAIIRKGTPQVEGGELFEVSNVSRLRGVPRRGCWAMRESVDTPVKFGWEGRRICRS